MTYYHSEGCAREDGPGWSCSCDPRPVPRGSWLGACRECSVDAMPGTSICADCRDRFDMTYKTWRPEYHQGTDGWYVTNGTDTYGPYVTVQRAEAACRFLG